MTALAISRPRPAVNLPWTSSKLTRHLVALSCSFVALALLGLNLVEKQSRAGMMLPSVGTASPQAPVPDVELLPIVTDSDSAIPRTRVHIVVTGDPEVNKVLTFTLYPFDDQFTYHIDYGDGYKQVARSKNRHLFTQAGNYRFAVTVLYGRDTVDFNHFTLQIREAVPISAYRPPQPTGGNSGFVMPRTNETEIPAQEEVSIVDQGNWEQDYTYPESVDDEPYMQAEVMPSFPGGDGELQRFLSRNLVYPDEARARSIEGKVVVQFIVETDGRLTNMSIIRELGYGCESEVLHALARMPRWNPGRQDGQVVRTYYVLPVTFKLM
ncbi:MAG: energy transducer TonB [Bacteroidota bacterium]